MCIRDRITSGLNFSRPRCVFHRVTFPLASAHCTFFPDGFAHYYSEPAIHFVTEYSRPSCLLTWGVRALKRHIPSFYRYCRNWYAICSFFLEFLPGIYIEVYIKQLELPAFPIKLYNILRTKENKLVCRKHRNSLHRVIIPRFYIFFIPCCIGKKLFRIFTCFNNVAMYFEVTYTW